MRDRRNKGAAQAIREYLRKKGRCTHAEIIADMPYDNAAIRYTIKDFLKRGEIRKLESTVRVYGDSPESTTPVGVRNSGTVPSTPRKAAGGETAYEYIGRREAISTKMDRVWRAMRYLPVFSANEVAMLAKVETEYVTDIIKRYKNAGYISKAGQRKRKHRGGLDTLYTLLNRDLRERPILRRGQSRIYGDGIARNSGTVPSEKK